MFNKTIDTIFELFKELLPMLIIFSVVLISVRLADIIINKKKVNYINELLGLLFVIYILMLFNTVTFQDVNYGTANFIPFKEVFRYNFGTRLFYKNVIGNMVMFMPYGFFVGYYLKSKKYTVILILAFILSLTIETTQSQIGRVFDVDDIILNVVGALLGYTIYRIIRALLSMIGVVK